MNIKNLEIFKIYQTNLSKIRYGINKDGGYVILDNLKYDCFISCGIGDEVSFEHDFIKNNSNIPIYFFDEVESEILPITLIHINGKNNLSKYIDKYNNIFIKMDIEGDENSWIESLSEIQLNKISQIIIEFHSFSTATFKAISKLLKTHYFVHIHGNNWGKILEIKIENIEEENIEEENVEEENVEEEKLLIMPQIFECTFIRKTEIKGNVKGNKEKLPSKFDYPNNSNQPDIDLNFYPFVSI